MFLPGMGIVTGALLVGTWASSLLYTLVITQAAYYFQHFAHDDWKTKIFVIVTFAIATTANLSNYACVYLFTVTHAGDPTYLKNQPWPVPVNLLASALVAVMVQIFLILRYWRFTQKTIITLFLLSLTILAFGSSIACGLDTALFPAFSERANLNVRLPGMMWMLTEAVAAIAIATALIWEFRKASTTFPAKQNTLNRLIITTIQTGSASALIAAGSLLAYLLNNESNVQIGILYCLSNIYALSMLLNVNIRGSSKDFTLYSAGASCGNTSHQRRQGLSAGTLFTTSFASTGSTDHNRQMERDRMWMTTMDSSHEHRDISP